MRVSVVMPLFNKQATVERAVRSIVSQSFQGWELIVVDDGSSDASLVRLRAVCDGRIRVVSQTNRGPGAARNRGVAASSGELLAFLDADDEWERDYLEHATKTLDSVRQAAAVSCCYTAYPNARSSVDYWIRRGIQAGLFSATAATTISLATRLRILIAQLAFMSPCTTVMRRDVFDHLGGFFERDGCRYGEDAFLYLKLLSRYSVFNLLEPNVRIHFEESELGNRRERSPQIEPFLSHPDDILRDCPVESYELIRQVLALRAFKSSCVLAAHGRWRDALNLRARFLDAETEKLELASLSMLMANPVGAAVAKLARLVLPSANLLHKF